MFPNPIEQEAVNRDLTGRVVTARLSAWANGLQLLLLLLLLLMAAGVIEVPARLMLIGPSHSGKSTLIAKLIQHRSEVFHQPPPERVIYCNAVLDGREAYLTQLRELVAASDRSGGGSESLWITDTVPAIDEVKSFSENRPLLLVVDDVLGQPADNTSHLVPLFTLHSHLSNVSVIVATQTAFLQNQKLDLVTLTRQVTTTTLLRLLLLLHCLLFL